MYNPPYPLYKHSCVSKKVQISVTFLWFRYVECTASAIQVLVLFKRLHPGYRSKEIEVSVANASSYIGDAQMSDGSW
jgi:hypothetical protein